MFYVAIAIYFITIENTMHGATNGWVSQLGEMHSIVGQA